MSSQSFAIEPLDESIDLDDAKTSPKWIVGSGQKVYWRSCFVMVYSTGNLEEAIAQHETCDGQGTVEKGIEIFLGGKGGKVKGG